MNIAQPTQILVTAYPDVSKRAALLAPATKQLAINMIRAQNRSGSTSDVGIVKLLNSQGFSLFTYDGTSTYAIVSPVPLAGANASKIFLAAGSVSNGYVVQSKHKSGIVGFTISQNDAASGVFVYEYWNGTAWSSLTLLNSPVYTSSADVVVAFLPPVDWAIGGPAGLLSTQYSIRVRATTLPGADVIINDLWCGALLEFYASVADKTGVSLEFDTLHPFILEASEGVMAYFSGANAGNGMTISYSSF